MAAVDLTARLVATAGNLQEAADIRLVAAGIHPVAAILRAAVHLRGVTVHPATHRPAELRRVMVLRSPGTADIQGHRQAVPRVHRRRRARPCCGSALVVEVCCC